MNLISSLLTNREPILTIHQKENYIQSQFQKTDDGMKFNLASNCQIEKFTQPIKEDAPKQPIESGTISYTDEIQKYKLSKNFISAFRTFSPA